MLSCYLGLLLIVSWPSLVASSCFADPSVQLQGDKQVCSGHGICDYATNTCVCVANEEQGFWGGPLCDGCSHGRWGASCQFGCAGGACNPCNGHGTCSDGLLGTGQCTCKASTVMGFWAESDCSECSQGYYDYACLMACPGAPDNVCYGHGVCEHGRAQAGLCKCNASALTGYWGEDSDCKDCRGSHWGPDCTLECPGMNVSTGVVCHGHGTCVNGTTGTGQCICDSYWYGDSCATGCPGTPVCSGNGICASPSSPTAGIAYCICQTGYAGAACEIPCPGLHEGFICSGHGQCREGSLANGSCICDSRWTGPHCSECAAGFFGPACENTCPGPPGLPCAGRGICSDGLSGNGQCTCDYGWLGEACTIECPLAQGQPCNSHGECFLDTARVASIATCMCEAHPVQGYWEGAVCDHCKAGWAGPTCDLECPGGADNPCSGHGQCNDGYLGDGKCWCLSRYFGSACECLLSADSATDGCAQKQCPPGYWGEECTQLCPGLSGQTPCHGHGTCSMGKDGDGTCFCFKGWAGSSCLRPCPVGSNSEICSGHGLCYDDGVSADIQCMCELGWAGVSCSIECEGGGMNPCSGHGTCSPVDGQCYCEEAWGGLDCSLQCSTNPQGEVCNGHGACGPITGVCMCDSMWQGTDCDQCISGYAGPGCNIPCGGSPTLPCGGHGSCSQGVSGNGDCECDQGWMGMGCEAECPGGVQNTCNGHGVCNQGCICEGDFYGTACDIFCAAEVNCSSLYRGQCSPDGGCECLRDPDRGYWTSLDNAWMECTQCLEGFWGLSCNRQCPCSEHGTCHPTTGKCACFRDPIHGYWDGLSCEACYEDYLPPSCVDRGWYTPWMQEFVHTGNSPFPSPFGWEHGLGILVVDEEKSMLYSGRTNLVRFHLLNGEKVLSSTSIDLGGNLTVGWMYGALLYVGVNTPQSFNLVAINTTTASFGGDSIVATWNLDVEGNLFTSQGGAMDQNDGHLYVYGTYHLNTTIQWAGFLIALEDANATAILTPLPTNTSSVHCAEIYKGDIVLSISIPGAPQTPLSYTMPLVGSSAHKKFSIQHITGDPVLSSVTVPPEFPKGQHATIEHLISHDGVLYGVVDMTTSSSRTHTVICKLVLEEDRLVVVAFSLVSFESSQMNQIGAFVIDDEVGVGILGLKPRYGNGVLYIFSLQSLKVDALLPFPEALDTRAHAMQVANQSRICYVLTGVDTVTVLPFSLLTVSEVAPALVDARGGTRMDIRGHGWRAFDNLYCALGEGVTPATFVNSTHLQCLAPVSNDIDNCDGVPLTVIVRSKATGVERVLNTSVTIRQVRNPTIISATPNTTNCGDVITVNGTGFQSTEFLACVLVHKTNQARSETLGYLPATFVNSHQVLCDTGVFGSATPDPTFIEVTLDGQSRSISNVMLTLVGYPEKLTADPTFIEVELDGLSSDYMLNSDYVVEIPQIRVKVIDKHGHAVLQGIPENTHLNMVMMLAMNPEPVFNESRPVLGAVTLIEELNISINTASVSGWLSYLLQLSVPLGSAYAVLQTNVSIETQLPGNAIMIRFKNSNYSESGFTMGVDRFGVVEDDSIEIEVLTETGSLYNGIQMAVEVRNGATLMNMSQAVKGGVAVFNRLRCDPHSIFYDDISELWFQVVGTQDIQPLQLNISLSDCPSEQFAVIGESAQNYCNPCAEVEGGVCDGTPFIIAQPGYFVSSQNTFVKCYNERACLGGDPSECAVGYKGLLCSDCMDGWARDDYTQYQCLECRDISVSLVIVCLSILTICLVIIVFTAKTLMIPSETFRLWEADGLVDVVFLFKTFVNHIHMTVFMLTISVGNKQWPGFIVKFIDSQMYASANFDRLDINCIFKSKYLYRFILICSIPFMLTSILAGYSYIWIRIQQLFKMERMVITLPLPEYDRQKQNGSVPTVQLPISETDIVPTPPNLSISPDLYGNIENLTFSSGTYTNTRFSDDAFSVNKDAETVITLGRAASAATLPVYKQGSPTKEESTPKQPVVKSLPAGPPVRRELPARTLPPRLPESTRALPPSLSQQALPDSPTGYPDTPTGSLPPMPYSPTGLHSPRTAELFKSLPPSSPPHTPKPGTFARASRSFHSLEGPFPDTRQITTISDLDLNQHPENFSSFNITPQQQFSSLVVGGLTVAMYMVNPFCLREVTHVMHCQKLQDSWFLQIDMRAHCRTSGYYLWLLIAILAGVSYALLFPIFRTRHLKKQGEKIWVDDLVWLKYSFLYRSYKKELWWWENVIHFRKVGLVLVDGYFRNSPSTGSIARRQLWMLWVVGVSLFAHMANMPYTRRAYNLMETISLGVMLVNMSFLIIFADVVSDDQPKQVKSPKFQLGASIFIMGLTCIFYLMVLIRLVAYFVSWKNYEPGEANRRETNDEADEDEEEVDHYILGQPAVIGADVGDVGDIGFF